MACRFVLTGEWVQAQEDLRRKLFIVGAAVIASVLSLGVAAWALERGPWRHRFGEREPGRMTPRILALLENDRFRSELGLSDQQAGRLRQIVVDAEKSSVKTRAEMAVRRIELRELLRADNPDRDTVIKKVQELSNLRGEMMRQHVEALLAAKTVLTAEQQKKLRAFIESHRAGPFRWEQFREHRGLPAPPEQAPKPPAP